MEFILIFMNICLFFVTMILFKTFFGTKLNPASVFVFWWLLNVSIALGNPLDYYQLSINSILIFYLPVVCSLIGVLSVSILPKKAIYMGKMKSVDNEKHSNWLYVSSILMLFFSLFFSTSSFVIAQNYGLDMQGLRNMMYSPQIAEINPLFSKISALLWFSNGVLYFLLFRFSYLALYFYSPKYVSYLILNLISISLLTVAMGGRGGFVLIIFMIFSIYFITSVQRHRNFNFLRSVRLKKYLYSTTGAMVVITVAVSLLREPDKNALENIIDYYVKYFTGTFYAFDQMVQTRNIDEINGLRFGLSFLGFDTVVVSGFFRFLAGSDIPSLLSMTSGVMAMGVEIRSGEMINAFYTALYTLYIDGGIVYICIYFFIFGSLSLIISRNITKNINFINFLFALLLYLFILSSPRHIIFENPAFAIVVIIALMSNIQIKVPKLFSHSAMQRGGYGK